MVPNEEPISHKLEVRMAFTRIEDEAFERALIKSYGAMRYTSIGTQQYSVRKPHMERALESPRPPCARGPITSCVIWHLLPPYYSLQQYATDVGDWLPTRGPVSGGGNNSHYIRGSIEKAEMCCDIDRWQSRQSHVQLLVG